MEMNNLRSKVTTPIIGGCAGSIEVNVEASGVDPDMSVIKINWFQSSQDHSQR